MSSRRKSGTERISVAEFAALAALHFDVSVLSDPSYLEAHYLDSQRVQKLGLALSGFAGNIHRGRIQIFGNSERSYLERLDQTEIDAAFKRLDLENISCILVTAASEPDTRLLTFADVTGIPLLMTRLPSSEAIAAISGILGTALAPSMTMHGVLMEVFGIGVMILGDSGIGKSECALDLIGRGHRLISDDSIFLRQIGDALVGSAPETIRDFLEIRGLGIINARELFGVSALAESAEVELCIEFLGIQVSETSDRLGLESSNFEAFGSQIPKYDLPVTPGRNLATLVEAAVRVFVSRSGGHQAVHALLSKHDSALAASNEN